MVISSNSSAERTRSDSCCSSTPSSCISSIIYLSSSSVIEGGCCFLPPPSFAPSFVSPVKIQIKGVMTNINTRKGAAIAFAKDSAFSLARLLGSISPKISTKTVITSVATPTLPLPRYLVKSTVARAEESIFTTLFPISMAVSALSKLSHIYMAFCALLFPSSASFLSLILLQAEKAVSVAEQIADIARSIIIKNISIKNIRSP